MAKKIENPTGARTVGGRNRRPTKVVEMNGNPSAIARRKRQNKDKRKKGLEPMEDLVPAADPASKYPAPAIKLPSRGQKYYDNITTALMNIGLISILDQAMLTRYAYTWDQWCGEADNLTKLRRRKPKSLEDIEMVSNLIANSNRTMMAQEAQLQSMEKQLGLTPAARATIAVRLQSLSSGEEEKDPDEAFLDGCLND